MGPNKSLSLERISSFALFMDQLNFETLESEKQACDLMQNHERGKGTLPFNGCIHRKVISHPASDSKQKPSGNVSVGDNHVPRSLTSSCSPIG